MGAYDSMDSCAHMAGPGTKTKNSETQTITHAQSERKSPKFKLYSMSDLHQELLTLFTRQRDTGIIRPTFNSTNFNGTTMLVCLGLSLFRKNQQSRIVKVQNI